LAKLSLSVESYFKRAQEILWEEDGSGNFYLIQLRLQEIPLGARSAAAEKLPSLLKERSRYYDRQGKIVCRGIASGPVVPVEPGQDFSSFPEGGILVAPCWSPGWKPLLPRVSAILVEESSPASLAFLARSYRVPTISNLPGVMKKTADPAVITVDAEDNVIYRGRVEPLLFSQLLEGPRLEDEPEYVLLEGLLRGLDHSYSAEETERPPLDWIKCRTLLQGIEWTRREATAILFDPGTWQYLVRDRWAMPVKAETRFPIYAVDLGGGVARTKPPQGIMAAVDQKEITSTPWLFIRQGSIPAPGVLLTDREGNPPLFLILGENSLFLTRSSGKDKVILDTALSRVTELNHFFLHWEGGEEGGPDRLSCGEKGETHEIRFFRKSALEVEEQLKQVGQRLFPS
jgi:phosphohistidine swiveling domain-containing protein